MEEPSDINVFKHATTFRTKLKKIREKYAHLKPEKPVLETKHKYQSILEEHDKKVEEFWQKSEEYEEALLNEIFSLDKNTPLAIKKDDVDQFVEKFHNYLGQREHHLLIYAQARLKQLERLNPGIEKKSYLVVHARNLETGEVKTRRTDTNDFLLEEIIQKWFKESHEILYQPEMLELHVSSILEDYKQKMPEEEFLKRQDRLRQKITRQLKEDTILPVFDKTPPNPKIEILYAQNVYELYKPDKRRKPNHPVRTLKFRVKSSQRELEKFVDWVTGVRNDIHYDSIASIEIVPFKEFYDSPQLIRSISDPKYFRVEYKNLPEEMLSDGEFHRIIREGNELSKRILSQPVENRTIPEETEKKLLKGIWIDHFFKGLPMETIVQVKEFHDWYLGPLGHDTYYVKNRDEKRMAKLNEACLIHTTQSLEDYFRPMYSVGKKGKVL